MEAIEAAAEGLKEEAVIEKDVTAKTLPGRSASGTGYVSRPSAFTRVTKYDGRYVQ
jgi:hypothetical protein